jgi:hypothetical protein
MKKAGLASPSGSLAVVARKGLKARRVQKVKKVTQVSRARKGTKAIQGRQGQKAMRVRPPLAYIFALLRAIPACLVLITRFWSRSCARSALLTGGNAIPPRLAYA